MKTAKIAVSGAHGTGKTTLCEHLNKRFSASLDFAICREVPRVIASTVRDNEFFRRSNNTIARQLLIFMYQLEEERKRGAEKKVLLCDRTPVDHLAYTLSNHPDFESTPEFLALENLIADWLGTFEVVFKVPIEFPLKDDGVREGEVAFQHEIDTRIDELYVRFGMSCPRVIGTVENRAKLLEEVITKSLNS